MKKLKIILHSNVLYLILFIFISLVIFIKNYFINYNTKFEENVNKIKATIVSYKIDGDKISFNLKEREKFVATYYIKNEQEKEYFQNNLYVGLKIIVEGEQQKIENQTISNTFDYKKYLYNKKIYFSFLIDKITLLNEKISLSNKFKQLIEKRIEKLNNNAYIKAFIMGDKSLMEESAKDIIKTNGVSHLFALSGMHLSFIYMFLSKILKKFKHNLVFIYAFLGIYLVIASFPVSFIRAILFSLFLDLNKKLSFNLSNIKILFLVAFILLLYNSFYIYDVGFIYTFVVTFSLLFSHEYLNNKKGVKQIITVSIITFLFSLPITIYFNYDINIFSIINNIILVPFVSIIIFPLTMLTFVFSYLLPIFNFLIKILELLNQILTNFSFYIIVGKINILDVLIYYFLLMTFLKLRFKFLGILLVFYGVIIYHKEYFDNYSRVYFLDVGQGDATLIVAPKNKEIILIDTGGKISYQKEEWQIRKNEFNLAENLVTFFKSLRIRKIDLLLITHGDMDHLGYANYIIDHMKIKSSMINNDNINQYEQDVINKTKRVLNYKSKCFDMNILNTKISDNENDNSIISLFQIEQFKLLLMGDASINVEKEIIKKYKITADFLKVGHHGSNTSSSKEFLQAINPKYAIISAGKNNRYHHPSKETIINLNNESISILNTQEMGTIELRIRKNSFNILSTTT